MKKVKNTKIGKIGITEKGGFISELNFFEEGVSDRGSSPLLDEAFRQVDEYLVGKRRDFDLPLKPEGTEFQKRVWNALLRIEYGKTASYKDVAEMAGSPKGFRAVGGANRVNPIPLIIPCHRCIAADGSIGGFSSGLDMKRTLLAIESPDLLS